MPNDPNYDCTKCGAPVGRELLTVKKVSFLEMGEGGKTLRSRVVGWLCPRCVAMDHEYNLEKFKAPGMTRTSVKGQNIA